MFINFFLTPLLASFVFIGALYPCAVKIGFTDKPSHRKQHKQPTPLIGGLAIYLAVIVTLFFNNQSLPNQFAFITAATLLVSVGLIDDYKGLGVRIRIIVQIIAGLIMAQYADIKIENLGDIFGFGDIHLGFLAVPFTVFAVVGGINAFNMIDGMDGLAGSLTLVSITALALISWFAHDVNLFSYCLIFFAAITPFLSLNLRIFGRPNAKIFLGDTGSTLFGFTVCWLAIDASQGENNLIKPATVLWIMALPLFDSVCIMLRRIIKGRSPFNPDREHLHHIFNVAGYSNNLTLTVIVIISALLSLTGIIANRSLNIHESLLFWGFIGLFASHYWLMTHAWKIMKISRYLRATSVFDRRADSSGNNDDQRSESDRRFIPSEHQLEKIYRGSGGLMAHLLGQRFRKANSSDRRIRIHSYDYVKNGLKEKRSLPDRRNSASVERSQDIK
jgi:UDP-GlcNAc:undecaprenyl-phosphate/decaprenyl-phosphate GlcNAc-1-phosphate transferase